MYIVYTNNLGGSHALTLILHAVPAMLCHMQGGQRPRPAVHSDLQAAAGHGVPGRQHVCGRRMERLITITWAHLSARFAIPRARVDSVGRVQFGQRARRAHALTRPPLQAANYLKSVGVGKGDDVTIYMPMIPELPAIMVSIWGGGGGGVNGRHQTQMARVGGGGGVVLLGRG